MTMTNSLWTFGNQNKASCVSVGISCLHRTPLMFEIWGISSSSQEGTCHKESLKLIYAEDWPFEIRLPIHIDNNATLTVLLPQPVFGPLE